MYFRVELAKERADIKRYVENKGNIIAELTHLATLSDKYVDDNNSYHREVTFNQKQIINLTGIRLLILLPQDY